MFKAEQFEFKNLLTSSKDGVLSNNMKNGLYHKVMGLPAGITTLLDRSWNLKFSGHAIKAAGSDRYGAAQLPCGPVSVKPDSIIEVEIDNNEVVKFVTRQPYSNDLDLILVIGVDSYVGAQGYVKTVWLNKKNDNHQTLNRRLYRRP